MPLAAGEESDATIQQWARDAFGPPPAPARIAARANEEMAELVMATHGDAIVPAEIAAECADIVIMLCRMADRLGFDLGAAIDEKMRVNRARRWVVEDGVGKHVA
jgi:NTP pyrophosphatase (non-canonical NTP hydrolase)